MEYEKKRIIDYPEATEVGANDFLLMSQYNESTEEYESKKVLASKVGGGGAVIDGVLEAGETTLTLQDSAIQTTSVIDYYTDAFGVNPTDATVTTGQIVLTFEAQSSDVHVKVRVS